MIKILVVDTDRSVRNILKEMLEYEGYRVDVVQEYTEAMLMTEKVRYSVVVLDRNALPNPLPDESSRLSSKLPVIVTSKNPSIPEAVRFLHAGVADYLEKPIDMNRLFKSIKEITSVNTDENIEGAPPKIVPAIRNPRRQSKVEQIVGESEKINHVKKVIDIVAPSDARVLIMGSNGTGKELVARWLHEKSGRRAAPFVEVNCAAIPGELIESELFGHEKGAFTSAIRQRKGKFEQADLGTIFLDEIGDMSLPAQAKVLRVLQERKITRVGSDRDIDIDVRVIAATNKNLRNEIALGNFREDLYHRLSVIVINVPRLSERQGDIPLLTEYFLSQICTEYSIPRKNIDAEAQDMLSAMPWTGNIRELRNVVERLVILSGNNISTQDVASYVTM